MMGKGCLMIPHDDDRYLMMVNDPMMIDDGCMVLSDDSLRIHHVKFN